MQAKKFGEKLSTYRQNKKMTQEEFSAKLGVTPQAVSKWERGLGLPDICILSDICRILNISADEMLQTDYIPVSEDGSQKKQEEVFRNLNISDALSLTIGDALIPVVSEGIQTDQIHKKRLSLARKGFLLPVIHIKDQADLKSNEFCIISYQRILYQEEQKEVNEHSFSYIIDKIAEVVQDYKNYAYILNRDIVKIIIDHVAKIYPILIRETVPSKISYGYLTEILKSLLLNGISICNINKIIEVIDSNLSNNISCKELIKQIEEEVQ